MRRSQLRFQHVLGAEVGRNICRLTVKCRLVNLILAWAGWLADCLIPFSMFIVQCSRFNVPSCLSCWLPLPLTQAEAEAEAGAAVLTRNEGRSQLPRYLLVELRTESEQSLSWCRSAYLPT